MATQKVDKGKAWAESLHERIAQNIKDARNHADMSAQDVADLTQKLGYGVSRDKIANYETRRKQGLDLSEFLIISAALRVPPVTLIFGGPPDELVEVLPGNYAGMVNGLAWLCGDPQLADEGITDQESYNARLLRLIRERARAQRDFDLARKVKADFERRDIEEFRQSNLYTVGVLLEQIGEIDKAIDALAEGDQK